MEIQCPGGTIKCSDYKKIYKFKEKEFDILFAEYLKKKNEQQSDSNKYILPPIESFPDYEFYEYFKPIPLKINDDLKIDEYKYKQNYSIFNEWFLIKYKESATLDSDISKITDYTLSLKNNNGDCNSFSGNECINNFNGKFILNFMENSPILISDKIIMTEAYCKTELPFVKNLSSFDNYTFVSNKEKVMPWESENLLLFNDKKNIEKSNLKFLFTSAKFGDIIELKEEEKKIYLIQINEQKLFATNINQTTLEENFLKGYKKCRIIGVELIDKSSKLSGIYDIKAKVLQIIKKELPRPVFGRPIYSNEEQITGNLIKSNTSDWSDYHLNEEIKSDINKLSDIERKELLENMKEACVHEHSSIASFAQLILELIHYGSSSDIILKATKAMQDEIKHTKMAIGIVKEITGEEYKISQLDINIKIRNIEKLKTDNYRDGCINELHSAIELEKTSEKYMDNGLKYLSDFFKEISEDEQRHSQLAFDIDNWLNKI